MKIRVVAAVALVIFLLSLCGCSKADVPLVTAEYQSELSYGVFEAEKITVLPWNSGRSEFTSYNTLAETENGYYFMFSSWLYYADKSDLSNWAVLCNKPNCNHYDGLCNGKIYASAFLVMDEKIYRTGDTFFYDHLYQKKEHGTVFVASDLDGSNTKIAYIPEHTVNTAPIAGADFYLDDQWIFFIASLDAAGIAHTKGISVSDSGSQIFWEQEGDVASLSLMGARNMFSIYGDKYFYCSLLSGTSTKIHRVENGTLFEIDISGLPVKGSYLSDSILRCFRQNDGYYDIDLTTGDEIRLMDARLENSYCSAILPNCILESTLLYPESVDSRIDGKPHCMEIFDGESWHSVELPSELINAPRNTFLSVRAVTSDGIWLSRMEQVRVIKDNEPLMYTDMALYRIPIGQNSWHLEYIGTVPTPRR